MIRDSRLRSATAQPPGGTFWILPLLNNSILAIADPLLGWLLYLPSDLALILLGAGTAALLTLVRPLTTNQDLLRRCRHDKRRLKELIRRAKRNKDRRALRNRQATRGMIAMMQLKAEGLPLLVAILPIAVLGYILPIWIVG